MKLLLLALLLIAPVSAATPTKAQIQAQLDATKEALAAVRAQSAADAIKYRTLLELHEQVVGIQKMRAEAQGLERRALDAEAKLARAQLEVTQLVGRNQALERKLKP